jgi:hypothetical protein
MLYCLRVSYVNQDTINHDHRYVEVAFLGNYAHSQV